MAGAAWAAIAVAFLAVLGFWTESRAGRRSLEAKINKLDTKIGELGRDLRGDIGRLDARIDAQGAARGDRIDAQGAALGARRDTLGAQDRRARRCPRGQDRRADCQDRPSERAGRGTPAGTRLACTPRR